MTLATLLPAEEPNGRIRVLWLIKGLGAGGAERLLLSLARVFDRDRFALEVAYVLPHKDAFATALREAGVVVHAPLAGQAAGGRQELSWLRSLRRLLLARDYDVLHVHSPAVAGLARPLVRVLPRSRRPAVVSTEHNSWSSYLRPTRLLNAALHRTDDARFAVSLEARDSMWPRWRHGVEVLTHGLVLEDYRDVADRRVDVRRSLSVPPGAVVVTTVANLRREKGYPELLEAAARVLRRRPGTLFLAAGQGDLRAVLHAEHRRLGLAEGFRFLGQVDDVPGLLAASDVFVLPSRYEGQPIALMEAMCAGLPVVATRVGGIPQQVDDGVEGVLLPPRDPGALADALERLVGDPEARRRMAEAAARRGGRYDIRTAAHRYEQEYTRLAGRARAATT